RLAGQRVDQPVDALARVVDRDDDADLHRDFLRERRRAVAAPAASSSSVTRTAACPSSCGRNRWTKASYRSRYSAVTSSSDPRAWYRSFSVVTMGPGRSRW